MRLQKAAEILSKFKSIFNISPAEVKVLQVWLLLRVNIHPEWNLPCWRRYLDILQVSCLNRLANKITCYIQSSTQPWLFTLEEARIP
ncbi:hypothetical protein U0070_020022, partial [Myodes glareolus]